MSTEFLIFDDRESGAEESYSVLPQILDQTILLFTVLYASLIDTPG